eukprot:gene14393-19319_t
MGHREEYILDLYKFGSINCFLESISDQTESEPNKNVIKKNNSVKPKSISSIKTNHTSSQREKSSPIYKIYFDESLDSSLDGGMLLCKIGWVLPCEVYKCMQCKLIFDSNNCKQHCYACGEIVCQSCCKYSAILKSCGYLTSDLWQVCNVCFESKDEDDIVAIGRNEETLINSHVRNDTQIYYKQTPSEFYFTKQVTSSVDCGNAFASFDSTSSCSSSVIEPNYILHLSNPTRVSALTDDNTIERYFISDISSISQHEYFVSSPSSVAFDATEPRVSLTSEFISALEYCNSLFSSKISQSVGSSIGDNESNNYGNKTTREAMLNMPYDVSELLLNRNNQNVSDYTTKNNIIKSFMKSSIDSDDYPLLLTLASLSIKDQFESNIQKMNKRENHNRDNYDYNKNDHKSHIYDIDSTEIESNRNSDITVNSNTSDNNQINYDDNDNDTVSDRSSVSSTINDIYKLSATQFMLHRAITAPRALIGWQIEFRLAKAVRVGVVTDVRKDKITNHTEFRIELSDVHEHKSPYLWLFLRRGKQKYGIKFKPIQKVLGHLDGNGILHPTLVTH